MEIDPKYQKADMPAIQSLHIYPLKSAQGITLKTAEVKPRGLAGDRRFMLVGKDGGFISQRQFPILARLRIKQIKNGIALSWKDNPSFDVPFPLSNSRQPVKIWRDTVNAVPIEGSINAALSAWLERPVTLVFMDDKSERTTNPKWTSPGNPVPSPVSFSDGYPILVTNTASLKALNAHITASGGAAIGMDRFRPNIVVDADTPWAENNWTSLQISDVTLDLVKPCTRCIVTSIDQQTGEKRAKSALAALKHLNPSTDPDNPGVIFGMNAVVRKQGYISSNSKLQIIGQ